MAHSAAWATGFTFQGVDFTSTDLRRLFRITEGGPWANPEVRGQDRTIPARDGQVFFDRRPHELIIVAKGFVQGTGASEALQRADFVDIRDAIRIAMDPTQDPQALVHTDEEGTEWTIDARPLRVDWSDDDRIPTYRDAVLYWRHIGTDDGFGWTEVVP